MVQRKKLFEGKSKILFEGSEDDTLVLHFKDDISSVHRKKKATITGKGVINNRISEFLMMKLSDIGIPTHFIRRLNMREQLVHDVDIVTVEITLRNAASEGMSKRFGLPEGSPLPRSIVEYRYKNEELKYPFVSEEHITAFGWATAQEIDEMVSMTLRINDFLSGLFLGVGISLIDFTLEFGRLYQDDGSVQIVLADEISPDNCRLWDIRTRKKLDKDRFRRDLGKVEEAYQEVATRLKLLPNVKK